jgi:NAD(P)-dependent dehydrogenase (short-subunit alcohol dehydrogenase family)
MPTSPEAEPDRGGVVVTGASTGIGAAIARRLAAAGYYVFGTVRRPEDAAALDRDGCRTVLLDVTDAGSIAAARQTIERELDARPLRALVNNAGIAIGGPLEHLPPAELRQVLEVNVIGVVAVTQAFLPALRRSGGRVINVSSVSGRLALPFGGPYAASKFALEAISDCLRRELIPSGIRVIVIQPGSVATPIWNKAAGRDLARYRDTPYAAAMNRALSQTVERGRHGLTPEAVGDAVLKALEAVDPPPRLLIARRPWVKRLMWLLPDRWMDRVIAKRLRDG